MAAEQATLLAEYPQLLGYKKALIIELNGPTSYATGGQTLNASQFGMGGIDGVISLGRSHSGTYDTRGAQLMPVDATPSAIKSGGVAQVRVPWYNISDALEVTATTDLSAQIVRLLILGT